MEVRKAGDVIFHRGAQLSAALCPRRSWTVVSPKAFHLHSTEGIDLTDLGPVDMALQKSLSDGWEALWGSGKGRGACG